MTMKRAEKLFGIEALEAGEKCAYICGTDKLSVRKIARYALDNTKEAYLYYNYMIQKSRKQYELYELYSAEYFNEVFDCETYEDFVNLYDKMKRISNIKAFL